MTDDELDAIKARIPKYGGGDMRALVAEVETLRQTLGAAEKERDQWIEAALARRQALHDADALRTGVYLALSPEGGVNGWRPSRGVDALIDLALDVREERDTLRVARNNALHAGTDDAADERAAVVAWLLRGTCDCRACMDEAVVRLAREIERGEHRREEDKP